jgi:hypothetical protein
MVEQCTIQTIRNTMNDDSGSLLSFTFDFHLQNGVKLYYSDILKHNEWKYKVIHLR